MRVAVGGTFDPIHEGHKLLLKNTLKLGCTDIVVGLTSDELASKTRDIPRKVRNYEKRKENIVKELKKLNEWGRDFRIKKLDGPYKIASEEPFDALVVSPETEKGGKKINEIRREKNLEPLILVVVPFVLAEDGKPISSTRIAKEEIDRHGNLL